MATQYRWPWGGVKTLLLLLIWVDYTAAGKSDSRRSLCPIGFTLVHTKEKEIPMCYMLKGPETFADKFEGCVGNLYSSKLLSKLSFTPDDVRLWADYKTLYPGGPFIDWSYTESTGDILASTFEVGYETEQGIEDEFCTVFEPQRNLTVVNCYERHYRYCFVAPYEELGSEGCDDGYGRLWSPRATCLQVATGAGGTGVRATWRQAQELCARREGALLQRGWRYANHPALHGAGSAVDWTEPLGIVMKHGDTLRWVLPEDGDTVVPQLEWYFTDDMFPEDAAMVALREDGWRMVNEAFVFYDVICERAVQLPQLTMLVTYDAEGQLGLNVSDSAIDENSIWCFTDSVIFYPSRVKITQVDKTRSFILKPITDGYYWCINSDTTNYKVTESNKALFIREKQSVENLYAIKLRIKWKYNFDNLEKLIKSMTKKLSEYIYLRTKYVKVYGEGDLNFNSTEKVLKQFKGQNSLSSSKEDVIYYLKLKRVYLDRRTVLMQAQVAAGMLPLETGPWEDFFVEFMKPSYYCKAFDAVPMLALDQSITVHGCKTYSCVGDFNEGVQWVETAAPCTERVSARAALAADVTVSQPELAATELMPTVNPMQGLEINNGTYIEETTTENAIWTMEMTTVETPTNLPEEASKPTTTLPPRTTPAPPPQTSGPPTLPPQTPQEQIDEVLESLELMINNRTEPIEMEQINNAADQVNQLFDLTDDNVEIPGEILQLIDELGARANLGGSQSMSVVRPNLVLVVADAASGAPVRGLRLAATSADSDELTEEAVHLITDYFNSTYLDSESNEVVVNLPESVALSNHRVTFAVFRNDRAFAPTPGDHPPVNSRVLSVTVSDLLYFDKGETIDIHLRPLSKEVPRDTRRTCAFWNFEEDGTGSWSQEGCRFIPALEGSLDVCRCSHLTHFAEVLAPRAVFSEGHERALEVISLIGCFLSIIGLGIVGLTAILFHSWRRDFSNKIWLHLCLAVFLLMCCFLGVVFSEFHRYSVACLLTGVALHYAVIASFCWMLVAAVLSYRRLVLVFTRDASHKLLRACAFAWGTPFAVVGILLAIDPDNYAGAYFYEAVPSGSFCYPTGLGMWLAVYAPIALALLVNWTLFVLIVRSVFATRRIQRHGDSNEALRCATVSCLLVFLFGLPWVFGLGANVLALAYLFNFTATFQGFILFVFFVVGNKKTRDMWLNKLKIKQIRKVPVTSSTYKSSGWRGGASTSTPVNSNSLPGAAALEANHVKPLSLSGREDEARFS